MVRKCSGDGRGRFCVDLRVLLVGGDLLALHVGVAVERRLLALLVGDAVVLEEGETCRGGGQITLAKRFGFAQRLAAALSVELHVETGGLGNPDESPWPPPRRATCGRGWWGGSGAAARRSVRLPRRVGVGFGRAGRDDVQRW